MRNFAAVASALAMIGVLAIVSAGCGGDSDDKARTATTPGAVGTARPTTAAAPTTSASSSPTVAVAAESFRDLSPDNQTAANRNCGWAAGVTGGADPLVGLELLATLRMRSGELGKTLEKHGKALMDAVSSGNPGALTAVAKDISAACVSIGWTAP